MIFYAFHVVTRASEIWRCLRFILPGFPAILILAAVGLEAPSKKIPVARRQTVVLACVTAPAVSSLGSSWWQSRTLHPLLSKKTDARFLRATDWARDQLPRDSTVMTLYASGSFYYYTDFPILR